MHLTHLFLPIETKVREYHAKVLLGCVAAEKGFTVVIGEQSRIRLLLARMPRGIFLDKSVVPKKARQFRELQYLGHRVAAWCEEGLIFNNKEDYVRNRISPRTLALADRFFAWGPHQKEAIVERNPDQESKIILTGNPRIDILRMPQRKMFDRAVDRIRRTQGRYLLINTNFSKYNHFHGREVMVDTWRRQGKIRTRQDERNFRQWIQHVGRIFHHFRDAVRQVGSHFPTWKIIVRPHPSENHGVWSDFVKDLPNVHMVHEGNVTPWILAADGVMHNNCSTGLEAFLCQKPVVAYCPLESERFPDLLPNRLSVRATTLDELLQRLTEIFQRPDRDRSRFLAEADTVLRNHLSALDGPLAADRIVASLQDLGMQPHDAPRLGITGQGVLWRRHLKSTGRRIKRATINRIRFGTSGNTGYQQQKFSGLSLVEMQQTIQEFQRLTRRFTQVETAALKGVQNCFVMTDNGQGRAGRAGQGGP